MGIRDKLLKKKMDKLDEQENLWMEEEVKNFIEIEVVHR